MRVGSVASGIAADAAAITLAGLPWSHAFFAEIAKFPSTVLRTRYPEVPNLGDMTGITDEQLEATCGSRLDLLVGGTPCQSFSVAGLRGGMADARGQLAFEFVRLAQRTKARWIVWENVPGALTADHGEAFRSLLAALDELGYGVAWRVLDAQHFGLAQRRKRIFLVGYLGDWRPAAAVLLEPARVPGDPEEGEQAGARAAGRAEGGARGRGVAGPRLAGGRAGRGHRVDAEGAANGQLVHALAVQEDNQNGVLLSDTAGTLRANAPGTTAVGTLALIPTHPENRSRCDPGSPSPALAKGARPPTIAFNIYPSSGQGADLEASPTDIASGINVTALAASTERGTRIVQSGVRRLTPTECEKLMGFPPGYTALPGAADGPRYAALGNSIAVPVLAWIFTRIAAVDALAAEDYIEAERAAGVWGPAIAGVSRAGAMLKAAIAAAKETT